MSENGLSAAFVTLLLALAMGAGCGATTTEYEPTDAGRDVSDDVPASDVAVPKPDGSAILAASDVAVPDDPRLSPTEEPEAQAAPDVAAPDVAAPDVAAPDVAAPDVDASDVDASDVAAPDVAWIGDVSTSDDSPPAIDSQGPPNDVATVPELDASVTVDTVRFAATDRLAGATFFVVPSSKPLMPEITRLVYSTCSTDFTPRYRVVFSEDATRAEVSWTDDVPDAHEQTMPGEVRSQTDTYIHYDLAGIMSGTSDLEIWLVDGELFGRITAYLHGIMVYWCVAGAMTRA